MKSNSGLSRQLEMCFSSISAEIERVVLAFSGGVDSCVLLHSLQSKSRPYKVELWHINHGLQDIAGKMEVFCKSVADKYKLDIEVSHLTLDPDAGNLESKARQARYELFERVLTPADCLLTAHHADDQAETLLQNMLRGSGSAGLRGIAYQKSVGRSTLLRPLLDISRTEILAYAKKYRLEWYDDPSNASLRFNRNYLRHQVIPKIKDRWPGYLDSIRSVVSIQAETQQLLDKLGGQDYELVQHRGGPENNDLLCCKSLLQLSLPRQKNLIRYWLNKNDCASLPHNRLNELMRQINSRAGSLPVVQGSGYELRIYNQCLFIVHQHCLEPLLETYDFGNSSRLKIDEIDLDIERESILKRVKRKDSGQTIKLKFRLNDKDSNPDTHRLKRLFQKHKIPPWKRMITPQVYLDDELVGLWF
jgi:tRNA(Ile)-lysidine synthase